MGDFQEAGAGVRRARERGLRLVANMYHRPEWLAKVEPLAALDGRLPAFLEGADHPKDVAERPDLAQTCYNKKLYAASARFWSEALEVAPKLGDDRTAQHRYNAACSAALAVAGQDKGDVPPDDAARSRLRRQALGWLKAELAAWSKYLEFGPSQNRTAVPWIMQQWRKDTDLVAVRDADGLAALPEAERRNWLALWGDVDALMRKAGNPSHQ